MTTEKEQSKQCFHCHEMIPKNVSIVAQISGQEKPMCCHGCKAVAEFIDEEGYCEFYEFRGDSQPNTKAQVEDKKWTKFDSPVNFKAYTKNITANLFSVSINLQGMYCSACGWLIDKHLRKLIGVKDVKLNVITKILSVEFQLDEIKLSQILTSINKLGYQPELSNEINGSQTVLTERKDALKRLVVAGFCMMFVMTLSVPLYSGEINGIEPNIYRFFTLVSMLIATVVYFYSGKSFLLNAYRDISNSHLGMDVPIGLSISLAYLVSSFNVLTNNGSPIYFDSMVMFVFFLLGGRYVEMSVRHQGMNAHDALENMIPVSVNVYQGSQLESLPYDMIQKGDLIEVTAGETIAIDGIVISGDAKINESMITGEALAVERSKDDEVLAGSLVEYGKIIIKSTAIGEETILASLSGLLQKAQLQKPQTLKIVDQVASWFVSTVLLIAFATAIYYGFNQPDKTMVTVLAVLVATCPCALSLATPAALTAASVKLMKSGILINNLDALSNILKATHWFFDKTGTLTEQQMSIQMVHNYSEFNRQELMRIAAALEQHSSHPIASAFQDFYHKSFKTSEVVQKFPQGLQGKINNQIYRIGTLKFCAHNSENKIKTRKTIIYLSQNNKLIGAFELDNKVRKGAKAVIDELKAHKNYIAILSGDTDIAVNTVAKTLGVINFLGEQTPEQKINIIQDYQSQNFKTVMIGDGVNDAPVLAQSDVSISFNQGTQLARAASDLIIMGNSLTGILDLLKISEKTNKIIKQNIMWALIYNLGVTPLAIMGYLTPWMAAIGMSLSSLFVVLNAKRILLK